MTFAKTMISSIMVVNGAFIITASTSLPAVSTFDLVVRCIIGVSCVIVGIDKIVRNRKKNVTTENEAKFPPR